MPYKDAADKATHERERRRKAARRREAARKAAATRRRRAAERRAAQDGRLADFERFCGRIGLPIEGFQLEIAEIVFSGVTESLFLLPRGCGKSSLAAGLGLFHLMTTREPEVICCAASREQAAHVFKRARRYAARLDGVEITQREIRTADGEFQVVSSDALKQFGWTPRLVVVDELHAHRNPDLFEAMQTSLAKRPDAQMVSITTAGVVGSGGPLEVQMARARGLPSVVRKGTVTRARGDDFAMIEWSLPSEWPLERAKECNPASWVTEKQLAQRREAMREEAFRRYHLCQWTLSEQAWLPAGSWQAAKADYTIEPGEEVWLGVDIGSARSASAVVWCTEDLRVGCSVFEGVESVLAVRDRVRELAHQFTIRRLVYDPMRFESVAMELQQERIRVEAFPQSHARMVPASERLYAAVIEGRLKHPDDPQLNAHVHAAVARDTERGWRLAKLDSRSNIDGCVAMAMAVEAAETAPRGPVLVGWL
jgi:phage terminase large subunit-like protein